MVGLMMTFALPYMKVSPLTRVRSAGNTLVRALELSRTRALSTKKEVRFTFDLSGDAYVGFLDDDNDQIWNYTAAESAALGIGLRSLGQGVVYGIGNAPQLVEFPGANPITFANDRVDFDNRGFPKPFGGRGAIYLVSENDANAVAAVTVTGSGAFDVLVYRDGQWQ